jgi:pseudouridine kinase
MTDHLPDDRPVLVAGGINADVLGRTLGPPALHTSNPATAGVTPGGVARNIAEVLAKLRPGHVGVRLLGAVGSDALGAGVLEATRAAGVDVSGVLQLPGQTGLYLAVLDDVGELHLGLAAMGLTESLTPDMTAPWLAEVAHAQLMIIDANLPPQTVKVLLQRAQQAGVRVIIEPVSAPKAARLAQALSGDWHGAFLLTPDQAELEALTGRKDHAGAVKVLLGGGVQNVLVTLGSLGSVLYSPGRIPYMTPAFRTKVQDVTGAGDALVAGLTAGLLRGLGLLEAVRSGHACAALTVASAHTVPEGLSWAGLEEFAARVP